MALRATVGNFGNCFDRDILERSCDIQVQGKGHYRFVQMQLTKLSFNYCTGAAF